MSYDGVMLAYVSRKLVCVRFEYILCIYNNYVINAQGNRLIMQLVLSCIHNLAMFVYIV